MPKRFSIREMALLTLPVLVIGAVGLYFSRRPQADDGKLKLSFRIAPPTALQAFEGYDSRWSVTPAGANAERYYVQRGSKWIDLRMPQGVVTSRRSDDKKTLPWGKIWGTGINGDTFLMRSRFLPPGEAHFNFEGLVVANGMPAPPSLKLQRVKGRWKIDRTQLKLLNLASWPRKPQVSLREVKIASIITLFGSRRVMGQTTFQFEGAKMTDETNFGIRFSSDDGDVMTGYRSMSATPKKNSRQRISEWTISSVRNPNAPVRISGRASADNRWPLGFQIEPFNFKTAKVGQKLKFRQFPVPLPQP